MSIKKVMDKDIRCINCKNHYSHEFKCKLDDSSTMNKKYEEIKECFVIADHLKTLDNISDLLDKMINKLP